MASQNLDLDLFLARSRGGSEGQRSFSPQTPTEAPGPGVPTPPLGRGGGPSYGQTPFGGYEAAQGLSPTERRSLQIEVDKGVAQRIRDARSVAPSSRQQTQGELINLTLLYQRLGNPFSVRRLPFSVLRDMTMDPMINFALHFCLGVEERILTADLRWVPCGDLRVGDRLLAFDEHPRKNCDGARYGRRWQWSEVTYSEPRDAPCVRVWLEDGRDVVCTEDHPWLAYNPDRREGSWKNQIWKCASELVGLEVIDLIDTWGNPTTYERGWLAGMLDGEGCLRIPVAGAGATGRARSVFDLNVSQNRGPVMDRLEKGFLDQGIDVSVVDNRPDGLSVLRVQGGYVRVLKALGMLRPERLLHKWCSQEDVSGYSIATRTRCQHVKVVEVEHIGVQPIQSLSTSTGTYIGEGFAMHNTDVPIVRAPYYIKCPDAQIAAAVDEALRPVNPRLQVQLNGKLSYGHQPICKRFKLGDLRSSYRDPNGEDPEHDIPVWTSSIEPIVWDTPFVLAPEHCMPRWNERGEFSGFYYSIIPLPNPIQIGLANLYGYSVVPGFEILPEFAMWSVNEIDRAMGSIYGIPRITRAYRYYWSYWYRWALADRAFENAADPPKYVYYPTDVPWALDPEDSGLEAGTPSIKHLQSLALSMGDQMRSGQTVAWPGDFIMDDQGRMSSHRKWEAGYYDPPVKFQELAQSFSYLDSLKFRCLTADTKIDCPRDHRRFPDGVPISMLKPGDPVWTFNLMTTKFELNPIKAAMRTGRDKRVFSVALSNGQVIRATANHPFLTTSLEWKTVSELSEGDRIVAFQRDYEPYVKLDPTSYGGCRVKEYHAVAEWMGVRGTDEGLHVHHVDGLHMNTSIENLQGVTPQEHIRMERTGRRVSAGTRERQSIVRLKIKDEIRAAKVSDLHAADDVLLEMRRIELAEMQTLCSVDGCTRELVSRGLCAAHYNQYRVEKVIATGNEFRSGPGIFRIKLCEMCGREYAPTGSRQYQCKACRFEHGILDNRTWRKKRTSQSPVPLFEDMCDFVEVLSVDPGEVEDVWDIEIDAPDECKNFVAGGVVVHNSCLIPEQAFIEGTHSSSSGSQGGSSRLMGIQLGEVYQESQQMLADENDRDINEVMIPQFIAANFPDRARIPCQKVTEGFGEYDTEIMKQVIQLVGQVKGNVLPVNIREVLQRMGIPVLTERQQKQQLDQIAKEAAAMNPGPRAPEKVGMQGYNAGVERTNNGEVRYVQPPQRIDLSTSGQGFLAELPNGVPAYTDGSVRASMMKLRKLMLERYKAQISSFVSMLSEQTTLHLAQQTAPQQTQPGQSTPVVPSTVPPAVPAAVSGAGLSAAGAAGAASALVASWSAASGVDAVQGAIAVILLSIAIRAAKRELQQAHLGQDVIDQDRLEEFTQRRAGVIVQSIDSTLRNEMRTFLEDELQKETDPKKVAQDAESRFDETAGSHAERVVLAEALPAYNHGALSAFRDAGVSQVLSHDASDGRNQLTDSECKRTNGQILSVDEALSRAADEHPYGTLWFSPLSTDNLVVERVATIPVHLNGHGEAAGYDADREVLYVSEDVGDTEQQMYTLTVGEMLRLR